MITKKYSPWPHFETDELNAVQAVLKSNRVNYWTGDEGRAFEREFAEFVGTRHAIAVANGTLALELALRGLEIGPGDEVIVTSRTFLASASCVIAVGAKPVFVDVESDSQNISARTIETAISERTKAIICVHLAGWPCEMDEIRSLAQRRHLFVIEDCAQAHGARYRGRSVGSLGDVGCWSFCQDKIMTTGGEGGMVTTDSDAAWERMVSYKDHGKSPAAVAAAQAQGGHQFKWLHESFGSNWRLTELQSAIGRCQLRKLERWTARRTQHARVLSEVVKRHACVEYPEVPSHIEHAWYKFYFFVRPSALKKGWTRDRIVQEMWARDVPCLGGSCSEIYLEKAFDGTGYRPEASLPVAKMLGERSLMMLVHPTLQDREIKEMAACLDEVLSEASAKYSSSTNFEPDRTPKVSLELR